RDDPRARAAPRRPRPGRVAAHPVRRQRERRKRRRLFSRTGSRWSPRRRSEPHARRFPEDHRGGGCMVPFLTFIHVLNCYGLLIVVLLQAGRGAGMAGVFGASAAGSQIFGGRGAGGFLGRLTAIMAIVFMISSIALTLSRTGSQTPRSVVREAAREAAPAPG